MKIRKPKPDDQEQAVKVFQIIKELFKLNPGIDPTIITSTLMGIIAHNYYRSDLTYEEYKKGMYEAIDFYKRYWE